MVLHVTSAIYPKTSILTFNLCTICFQQDTFALWKEALQITPQAESKLPRGLLSWAESAVDSHYGRKIPPMLNIRDMMRRSSLMEWDTRLKPAQEEKLRRRIVEKTRNSDVMDLWKELEAKDMDECFVNR